MFVELLHVPICFDWRMMCVVVTKGFENVYSNNDFKPKVLLKLFGNLPITLQLKGSKAVEWNRGYCIRSVSDWSQVMHSPVCWPLMVVYTLRSVYSDVGSCRLHLVLLPGKYRAALCYWIQQKSCAVFNVHFYTIRDNFPKALVAMTCLRKHLIYLVKKRAQANGLNNSSF